MSGPSVILATGRGHRSAPGQVIISLDRREIYGDGAPWRFGSLYQFRFAVALFASRGGVVEYRDLVEHVWGDEADGGPANTRLRLATFAHFFNRRCRNWRAVTVWGRGIRLERAVLAQVAA